MSSVTAVPAWRAFASYLVIGRCTEMGSCSPGSAPPQQGFGVADLGDLLGIARVVGGRVQHTARAAGGRR